MDDNNQDCVRFYIFIYSSHLNFGRLKIYNKREPIILARVAGPDLKFLIYCCYRKKTRGCNK